MIASRRAVIDTGSVSFTVAEACRLLGESRPTVKARVAAGELATLGDERPLRLERDGLVRLLTAQRSALTRALLRVDAALAEAGAAPPLPTGTGPSTGDGALAMERTGRALAEARIEELKDALRRTSAAVHALLPNPDADADAFSALR